MSKRLSASHVTEILRHYAFGIAEAAPAHATVTVLVFDDPATGIAIVLRAGQWAAQRRLPLEEFQAESMVDELAIAAPKEEQLRRALAHALVRAGRMYEETGLERLTLELALVHRDTYGVVRAALWSRNEPKYRRRLTPHAHDDGGRGYRPSGQQ